MSGRLTNASQVLTATWKDVARPTRNPLPTITTKNTAAVSATARVTCRSRLKIRGTDIFLPATTKVVVSTMGPLPDRLGLSLDEQGPRLQEPLQLDHDAVKTPKAQPARPPQSRKGRSGARA